METIEKIRQNEAVRLLRWIAKNPETWDELCSGEEVSMTNQKCIEYTGKLWKEGFYPIIAVLLTRHFGRRGIGNALITTAMAAFAQRCEDEGVDWLLQQIVDAICAEERLGH